MNICIVQYYMRTWAKWNVWNVEYLVTNAYLKCQQKMVNAWSNKITAYSTHIYCSRCYRILSACSSTILQYVHWRNWMESLFPKRKVILHIFEVIHSNHSWRLIFCWFFHLYVFISNRYVHACVFIHILFFLSLSHAVSFAAARFYDVSFTGIFVVNVNSK